MVLGNRIGKMFKTIKQNLASFVQKKTDDKVLKVRTDEISENADTKNRKRKSRWSSSNWLGRLLRSTSSQLTEKEREVLAKNWFGNFRPVEKFQFKRGSKTPKQKRYA